MITMNINYVVVGADVPLECTLGEDTDSPVYFYKGTSQILKIIIISGPLIFELNITAYCCSDIRHQTYPQ